MNLYVTHTPELIETRRRMMRRFFEENFNAARVMSFPVNMVETDEEYTLKAFLPGLTSDEVNIQFNNGTITDISEASDILNISVLSKVVKKHYLCYPKEIK